MKIELAVSKKWQLPIIQILLFSIICIHVLAQTDLPKVGLPSPEVTALFRFQDYPMDYSTGVPNISIPIYEVKSGSLSVPISISYHASGRRVSDQDGPIALGWSLNAGGLISRTVYGDPDFGTASDGTYYFPYPFAVTGLSNANNLEYLEKIMHFSNQSANVRPWTESEYDIFSYSFGGNSGKFIFKDSNNIKTPVLLPYKPYIITPYYTFRGLTGMDILDDKGVLYKFATTETSGPDDDYAVTAISLNTIISADKTDTISFKYTGFAQWNSWFSQRRVWLTAYNIDCMTPPTPPYDLIYYENPSNGTYQIKRLTEIDFKQGKVLFNLVSGSDKIDNIQIMDINNQVIKIVQLNRSSLDGLKQGGSSGNPSASQLNNKLTTLIFKDKIGNSVENYSFEYYPTKYFGTETKIDVHYCDWWGYYNASGRTNMVPDYDLGGGVHNGGTDFNRSPDLEALKSGMIKKITYPTGGSTSFAYENNQYADPGGKPGPGLRIFQITSTDNNGGTSIKTYKYGVGEVGYGFLDLKPGITTMASQMGYAYIGLASYGGCGGTYGEYTFLSGFLPSLSALASRPVVYTEVAEYQGTPANNSGKTVYQYDNYAWAVAGMPSYTQQPIIKMHVYNWNFWNNPSLLTKSFYKSKPLPGGGLTYTLKKNISNGYMIVNLGDVAGLHVQRLWTFPQEGINGNYTAEQYGVLVIQPPIYPYTFSDYHIPVGVKNLNFAAEIDYNEDGSIINNTTTYTYNSHQYLSQTSVTTSDGGNINSQIKYPFDYTGNPVLSQMGSLNMLDYPVEQAQYKNVSPLNGTRYNYYNFGSTLPRIYPLTVEASKGIGSYETRLHYYSYDNDGNLVSAAKENDILNAYIWDYNTSYPVAEVKNASVSDVAFTSFEADGMGGWSNILSPNISADVNSPTGARYYNLGSPGLSKTGLSTTTSYIVSYWSKGGQYSVSGTSASGWPKNLRTLTINGVNWTNWEHNVSGVSSITVSGTGGIDELRLYPANAQMSTYTFSPLIGMTSQTDINNRTTYYEYDAYGRVKLIRDLNKNIIKTFVYQYNSPTP